MKGFETSDEDRIICHFVALTNDGSKITPGQVMETAAKYNMHTDRVIYLKEIVERD